MEGDAKGQVGGMEMPEKERKRLAGESRSWKCQGCGGRSNEDILREEGGEAVEGTQSEHVVPEGLRFGFKDEMGKPATQEAAEDKLDQTHLIVATAPAATTSSSPATTSHPTPASSSSTSPQPMRNMIVPSTVAVSQPVMAPVRQAQSDGVPAWIDKAITGLAAALAVMVIKKILL